MQGDQGGKILFPCQFLNRTEYMYLIPKIQMGGGFSPENTPLTGETPVLLVI